MLEVILRGSQSDIYLAELYSKVEEYAQLYLLAKRRQKGCDGLGEMTNLKDELSLAIDDMMEYCKEKNFFHNSISYNIDSMIEKFEKGIKIST